MSAKSLSLLIAGVYLCSAQAQEAPEGSPNGWSASLLNSVTVQRRTEDALRNRPSPFRPELVTHAVWPGPGGKGRKADAVMATASYRFDTKWAGFGRVGYSWGDTTFVSEFTLNYKLHPRVTAVVTYELYNSSGNLLLAKDAPWTRPTGQLCFGKRRCFGAPGFGAVTQHHIACGRISGGRHGRDRKGAGAAPLRHLQSGG